MNQTNIDKLWEEYYPKVYGYFYRRINIREDVEDLTSIVLTIFLTKLLENPEKITRPNGLLWKIAYNHLVDYIDNKRKKPIPITIENDFIAPTDLETELQAKELEQKLSQILSFARLTFSEEEYMIFSGVYIDGTPIRDIAYKLNLKANTVTVKLKRLLQKLKIHLDTI